MENGFVFSDTSFAPAPWPLPRRKSARQAEAETQRQLPVGGVWKGHISARMEGHTLPCVAPSVSHPGGSNFPAQRRVHFLSVTLFLL